jgi:hypothetical protein
MNSFKNDTNWVTELLLNHNLGLTVQQCYEIAKLTKVDHFTHLTSSGQFVIYVKISSIIIGMPETVTITII